MKASAIAVVISFFLLTALHTLAQNPATPAPLPKTGVVLVKLSPPIYPPLAHQAWIKGDVKIQVSIRKDGSVESAEVVSGHPMLKLAALQSARKSQYECRDCGNEINSYRVTYTFGFLDDEKSREVVSEYSVRSVKRLYLRKCGTRRTSTWGCPESRPTEIKQSGGHVTMLVSTACVETTSSYEANERLR